jgi:hypothetical protein
MPPPPIPGLASKRQIHLQLLVQPSPLTGKTAHPIYAERIHIFGYNGSGKSGYGRILRRACSAAVKPPYSYCSHAEALDFDDDGQVLSRSDTKAARRKPGVESGKVRGDPL